MNSKLYKLIETWHFVVSVLVATAVICLAILCIACAKRRHKKMLREAGFRYSQV